MLVRKKVDNGWIGGQASGGAMNLNATHRGRRHHPCTTQTIEAIAKGPKSMTPKQYLSFSFLFIIYTLKL